MMIRDDSITLCSGSPQPIKAFWGAMLGNDKRSVFAFKCALHTFDRAGRRLAIMEAAPIKRPNGAGKFEFGSATVAGDHVGFERSTLAVR